MVRTHHHSHSISIHSLSYIPGDTLGGIVSIFLAALTTKAQSLTGAFTSASLEFWGSPVTCAITNLQPRCSGPPPCATLPHHHERPYPTSLFLKRRHSETRWRGASWMERVRRSWRWGRRMLRIRQACRLILVRFFWCFWPRGWWKGWPGRRRGFEVWGCRKLGLNSLIVFPFVSFTEHMLQKKLAH